MSVSRIPQVASAKPLGPYRLRVQFDDGVEGEVDLSRMVAFDGIFEPLASPDYFARVSVNAELGTVVWPNGADLDPLVLHAAVTGDRIELASSATAESVGR